MDDRQAGTVSGKTLAIGIVVLVLCVSSFSAFYLAPKVGMWRAGGRTVPVEIATEPPGARAEVTIREIESGAEKTRVVEATPEVLHIGWGFEVDVRATKGAATGSVTRHRVMEKQTLMVRLEGGQ